MYAFMFSPSVFSVGPRAAVAATNGLPNQPSDKGGKYRPSANAVWGRNLYAPYGCRRAVHAWQPGGLVCSRLTLTSVCTGVTPGHFYFCFYFDFYEWTPHASPEAGMDGCIRRTLGCLAIWRGRCTAFVLSFPSERRLLCHLGWHSVMNLSCGLGGGVVCRSGLIAEPLDR